MNRGQPRIILSGFADEGPADKKAESQLAMVSALGMSHYSLRFVNVGQGVKNVMQLTKREIRRLRRLHDDFGMKVSSIGSPIGKVKLEEVDDGTGNAYVPFKEYLKTVLRAVELAQEFETRLVRGFSFYHPRGTDARSYVDKVADRLSQIVEICARAGIYFGLEVEANLVGQNGQLLRKLFRKVNSDHLYLIFDGGNLTCQNMSSVEVFEEYRAMKRGLGWMHVKDYQIDPNLEWAGYVDEERLRNFVPADRGDSGYEAILRDFKAKIPGLERKLRKQGIPGVFLELEPHLKAGGQFGGNSGCDGFGIALRALCRLLDYVGISYQLRDYEQIGSESLS